MAAHEGGPSSRTQKPAPPHPRADYTNNNTALLLLLNHKMIDALLTINVDVIFVNIDLFAYPLRQRKGKNGHDVLKVLLRCCDCSVV